MVVDEKYGRPDQHQNLGNALSRHYASSTSINNISFPL